MDKILESISEHIQDIIGDAYDLFAEEKITRQKYIDFLSLQAKMLNKEAEGHKEFMDKLDILKKMNTEEFNKAVKPLSDKWTDDLVTHLAQITENNQLDEDILELCKGTDDAIREEIIKHIESTNQVPEKIQSLAEDILKLHRPDPQYSHHESSCRKCNSTEIDTVVAKQKEEINKLKKELDNSKFGAQCSVHELEYDKKTLIKENLELKENAERIGVNRYRQLCEAETNIEKLMKALKSLICTAEKDEINKDHLDVTLRKARNVIADIDPTIEKCDCCY